MSLNSRCPRALLVVGLVALVVCLADECRAVRADAIRVARALFWRGRFRETGEPEAERHEHYRPGTCWMLLPDA